jgi:hypothetical protein
VTQAREAQHRCAYVRVPPGHPLHGKDDAEIDVNVHGGISLAAIEPCAHEDGIGWWFGFDFAHCYDAMFDPNVDRSALSVETRKLLETMGSFGLARQGEHFWTQAEAERECESLAEQLAAIGAECR